jgi:hypothetical protein
MDEFFNKKACQLVYQTSKGYKELERLLQGVIAPRLFVFHLDPRCFLVAIFIRHKVGIIFED